MRRSFAVLFLVLWSASLSFAQTASTTRQIPFSNTALDETGAPVNGEVTLTLELYQDQEGGAPLWREMQRAVTDARGRFLVYLGAVRPLPQAVFTQERARWLSVTIDGRSAPRVMLVAVPYALRAADANTLDGHPASAFVRSRPDGRLETSAGVVAAAPVDGTGVPGQLAKFSSPTTVSSSVISESATNRIGVGLPDPTGGGVVDSVFTIRNFDNNTGFAILNQSQARRFALNTMAAGGWIAYDGGSGVWNQGLSQINGNVGIGSTSSGLGRLEVRTTSSLTGILAVTVGARGIEAQSNSNIGIVGFSTSGVAAVAGQSFGSAAAGQFNGNVNVTGTLTKGGGTFKIDHPLDPTKKYLQHSFVESPDMMNIYNGNVILDVDGAAWVTLPAWFEALNGDFRYQLTAVGAPGPNLYVATKISGNRFKIAGGTPQGEVSWQVTGIRHDAWANAHRVAVEQEKPANERGTYMHPNEHGHPESGAMPLLPNTPSQTGPQNNRQ